MLLRMGMGKYSGLLLDRLASDLTDGFTGSDLERGCTEVKRRLFRKRIDATKAKAAAGNSRGAVNDHAASAELLSHEEVAEIFRATGATAMSDKWHKSYDRWKQQGRVKE